jgi:adenylate cyclase
MQSRTGPSTWIVAIPVRLRRSLAGAGIGLAAGLVVLGSTFVPLIDQYERQSLDLRIRTFSDSARADPRIVTVAIDQASIDIIAAPRERGGFATGWPWPRDFYAMAAEYLLGSGARLVAFDIMFSERSIYTQVEVLDDDKTLAAACRDKPVAQAAMFTRETPAKADTAWPDGLRDPRYVRALARVPRGATNKATLPLPGLLQNCAGLGWIGFEPDPDGTARSIRPAVAYAPEGAPSAVEVWAFPFVLAGMSGARVDAAHHERSVADGVFVGGKLVPLDEDRRMLLRFHGGEGTYRQFSFASVLDAAKRSLAGKPIHAAMPQEFRDKIVIVGTTASGLLDLRNTSVGATLPGYLIHATALDNLLHGDALVRIPSGYRYFGIVLLGMWAGVVVASATTLKTGFFASASGAAIYVIIALWVFHFRGVWLDLVAPLLALGAGHAGSTAYAYLTEGRQRRFLSDAFSRYVAPGVVQQLLANPGSLSLGGSTREVTIMFADVAGFTTLSEGRDPASLVELMNECFTEITTVIQGHGGTVDKFIGDAVMAFWNAPVEQADHAARACRAGRDLLKVLDRLNVEWSERGLPRISMRVGLASGPAVVGNVGSSTKFNYTVMGDTVNLASRLEGAAKVYHTLSLVAGSTVELARDAVPVRELDLLQVKGKNEGVPVFELIPEAAEPAAVEAHRRYADGLSAYRERRFKEAVEDFEAVLAASPSDGPAEEMLASCREYLITPPPDTWRGERVLTAK